MVFIAHEFSDFRIGHFCVLSGKVHAEGASEGDGPVFLRRIDVGGSNTEECSNSGGDIRGVYEGIGS